MKMNNVLRRALALLLAITMCVGMISTEAFAAEITENLEARELICGKEEHTHTEDCYAPADPESIPLLCTLEESDGHTHTEDCIVSARGELTCPLEESEGHTHSEACEPTTTRDLICGQNELGGGHTHVDACYAEESVLTCGQDEIEGHTHNDECYTEEKVLTCELQEDEAGHEHTDECYTTQKVLNCELEETESHAHSDACYTTERKLVCGQEETEGHVHTDDCYAESTTTTYSCGLEESEGHTHTDGCYAESTTTYTCGLEESAGHKHSADCYDLTGLKLVCPTEAHSHGADCYDGEGNLICTLEEHTHTVAGCYQRLVCNKEEHTHTEECYSRDSGIATINESSSERSDIRDLVTEVKITDAETGEEVKDGKLQVGEKYKIHIKFREDGLQGLQFSTEGTLTYQFPGFFKMDPKQDTISVEISDTVYELSYTVDENGKLTISLPEDARQAFAASNDVKLTFEMEATAQKSDGSGSVGDNFGGAGKDFTFEVTDQPRVKVEKNGVYKEYEDHKGGTLSYTVKVTVEHGELCDAMLKDVLTPPQNSAFELEGPKDVTVTLERDSTKQNLTAGSGYNYEKTEGDLNNPQDKAFQVSINDPLQEGDVLYVTYSYAANVINPNLHLWANVENVATFTGYMPVENPDKSGETTNVLVEEEDTDSFEIRVTPTGHGVVCKDQNYSETTKTLHYTLYTVVPAGTWTPLQIYDDMYVQYNGEKWYLKEFTTNGKVKNLTVSAVDVRDWFGDESWADKTTGSQKIEKLRELVEDAKKLTGYPYDGWGPGPEGYDSTSQENYLYYFADKSLYIIFGDANKAWGEWGTWDYGTDRLIITEYDLDMSATEPMTLYDIDDAGKTQKELKLTPEEVLKAGITNNVNLRYGGFFPGYSVFFNNTDDMTKTGELNKEEGTIDYTVTINTTDSTVRHYFNEVAEEWYELAKSYEWDTEKMYSESMKAVFYDRLPEGWEYVKGSLYAVAFGQYNRQEFHKINCDSQLHKDIPLDKDNNICVPLVVFQDDSGVTENSELNNWFIGGDMTSLEFHYTLKATDEWLKAHATANDPVPVNNHAEIKDEEIMHWSADKDIEYYPAKLTKKAEQVEKDANLLRFTIEINPEGVDYDPKNDKLVVTDKSTNLEIRTDTIKVKDAAGKDVSYEMLPGEGSQFKLQVPDGMALTITYDAIILEEGPGIAVSNTASIDGVALSDSGYSETLNVSKIYGSGDGNTYELIVKKTDDTGKKSLAGAEFKFYVIRTEGSALEETGKITFKGEEYSVHTKSDWKYSTDNTGRFTIKGEAVEPGNYYFLEETAAPTGYQKLEKPILLYYGFESDMDENAYPGVVYAPSILTVKNEPNPEITLEVEKKIEGIKTTNEKFTFQLKNGEKVIDTVTINGAGKANFKPISYTAAGTYSYTITETKGENSNWTYDETVWNASVTVEKTDGKLTASAAYTKDNESANCATFTNTYNNKGSLTVEKNMTVPTGFPLTEKILTFDIEAVETAVSEEEYVNGEAKRVQLDGTFQMVNSEGKNIGSVNFVNGWAEIKLTVTATNEWKNSVTIKDLPTGVYVVKELKAGLDVQDYVVTVDNQFSSNTVEGGKDAKATVTNNYKPDDDKFTLKLTKTVLANHGTPVNQEFTFQITGTTVSGEKFEKTITVMSGSTSEVELEPGKYTINETGNTAIEGFTWNGVHFNGQPGSWTVEFHGNPGDAQRVVTVEAVNSYTEDLGALTITKNITGDAPASITDSKVFTFTVTGPENYSETVTITGNGSVTLRNLVPGTYTVTEQNADIEGYTLAVDGNGEQTVEHNKTTTVTVTNNYKRDHGDLTVEKTMTAPEGFPLTKKTLTFDIEAVEKAVSETQYVNGEAKRVQLNGTFDMVNNEDKEVGSVTFTNGWAEIKLTVTADGDWKNSITIKNLPTGVYVVKELKAGLDVQDYVVTVANQFSSNKVEKNENTVAKVTNEYKPDEGEFTLKFTKTVLVDRGTPTDRNFTFKITGTTVSGESVNETVTVNSNSTSEVKLRPGKYTITETGDTAIEGFTWNGVYFNGQPGPWNVEFHSKPDDTQRVVTVEAVNSYTQDLGSLTITKNITGNAPQSLTNMIYTFTVRGPSYPDGHEVTVTGSGSVTLSNLIPGKYTVNEENANIDGYTWNVTGQGAVATVTGKNTANVSVTNNYTQKLGGLTITKSVQGGGTAAANKDYNFTVKGPSYPDGHDVTITGNGSVTLSDIIPGEYTVTEQDAGIDGYNWTVTGQGNVTVVAEETAQITITNTFESKLTSVPVEKVWKNIDGSEAATNLPASVTINLYANGKLENTMTLTAASGWKGTFENLPEKDADGNDIIYTVDEVTIPGWTKSVEGNTITNTREESEKTEISVKKIWKNSDGTAAAENLPASVTVTLLRNGETAGQAVLNAENGWAHTFTGLDKNDVNGDPILYTVQEGPVDGWTQESLTGDATNGFTVTNQRNKPGTTGLSVTKKFVEHDGVTAASENLPESVTVRLYENGEPTEITVNLSAENNWSGSFTDLPEKDVNGNDITYTMAEDSVPGWTAAYTNDGANWSITNTRDTISLTVNKVWADSDGNAIEAPAGASVTVRLFDGETELSSFELTAESGWTHTFAGLAPDGDYRITEDEYTGFTTTVTVNEDGTVTITNTQTPPPPTTPEPTFTSVSVNKVWNDAGNEDVRPASIQVQLYQNGAALGGPVTLSESNSWSYTWTGLNADYSYAVVEVNIPEGYTATIGGSSNSYTITNTYNVPETEPELGALSIVKSVVGGGDEAANKVYTFDVVGPDEYSNTVSITGAGSVVLTNLAPGEYTITEQDAGIAGYTLSVTGEGGVAVTAGSVASIEITNSYETETQELNGSLTITKVVEGGPVEAAESVEYVFDVVGPNGYSTTVSITGEGSVTLSDLVPGVYTVTERDASLDGWTWTVDVSGDGTVQAGANTVVVATNTYEEDEDIPDDDTPLTDIPESDIPDADVPKSDIPEEDEPTEDIPDSDVPLDKVPQTGDSATGLMWLVALAASAMGLAATLLKKKDENI